MTEKFGEPKPAQLESIERSYKLKYDKLDEKIANTKDNKDAGKEFIQTPTRTHELPDGKEAINKSTFMKGMIKFIKSEVSPSLPVILRRVLFDLSADYRLSVPDFFLLL